MHEVTQWADAEPVMTEIRAATLLTDRIDPLDEAARLRLKHHGLDGSRLWLAGAEGFALLHHGSLDLAVAPVARARGLGRALAEASAPFAAVAWSHGDHPAAAALAARLGWHRARELWVMRLEGVGDGAGALDASSTRPDLTIRPFRPGDEPTVLALNAAAFAHHPEQGGMDAANLADRMSEPWFDPDGLLIGEVDGEPVGFHWTKQHDARHGEVYVIGVAPAGQGRGLGRALTAAGIEHLRSKGVDEVLLYVEADNLAGRRLYEGLGFRHAARDTHVQYAATSPGSGPT